MSVTHPWDWLGSHRGRKWLERLLSGPGCQPLVWGLEKANMYLSVPRAPPGTSALCLLQTVFPSSPPRFTMYLSPGHALPPSEFALISYLSLHLPVREFCPHPQLRHPSCSATLMSPVCLRHKQRIALFDQLGRYPVASIFLDH